MKHGEHWPDVRTPGAFGLTVTSLTIDPLKDNLRVSYTLD